MEFKASLNNLRMSPRKARLVANLVKGMNAAQAKAQLMFTTKKSAPLILKLLNSTLANVKHNYNLEINENNLYIKTIVVEGGPMLKRWLPRAMGRATPIMKRTCSIKLVLADKEGKKVEARISKPEVLKPEEVLAEPKEIKEKKAMKEEAASKGAASVKGGGRADALLPLKPYGASGQAKKRLFSRQTLGNIKKAFRRKSI